MPRYRLTIEYDGQPYKGFQAQDGLPSVQGSIERAVKAFSGQELRLQAAGRTDTGLRTHVEGSRTTFEQDIWLSSRESLDPIDVLQVAREGTTLSATVNVHVAETEPGRPVPAYIRPVNLRLHIEGLPPGDYTLQLRRAES